MAIVDSNSSWITADSIDEMMEELGVDKNPWVGTMVEALIYEQQEIFQMQTSRHVEQRAISEEPHDGTGHNAIVLDETPVSGITLYERDTSSSANHTEIDSTDYDVDTDHGVIKYLNGMTFMEGIHNFLVSYTAGWTIANIPRTIKQCIKFQVMREVLSRSYKREDGETIMPSVQSVSQEGYSVNYGNMGPYGATIKYYDEYIKKTWKKYTRKTV